MILQTNSGSDCNQTGQSTTRGAASPLIGVMPGPGKKNGIGGIVTDEG